MLSILSTKTVIGLANILPVHSKIRIFCGAIKLLVSGVMPGRPAGNVRQCFMGCSPSLPGSMTKWKETVLVQDNPFPADNKEVVPIPPVKEETLLLFCSLVACRIITELKGEVDLVP